MTDTGQCATPPYELFLLTERRKHGNRLRLIFQLYAVVGALAGVIALAYYFIRQLDLSLTATDATILITAGVCLATSLISAGYLLMLKARTHAFACSDQYVLAASKLLARWGQFEEIARARLESMGIPFNPTSIREIVARLQDLGLITHVDAATVEEALRLRNDIVHGGVLSDRRQVDSLALRMHEITRRVETVTTIRQHGQPARGA